MIATVRELFGKGTIMGWKIIGPTSEYLLNTTSLSWLSWYQPNNLMVLFPSAMFVLGIIIWLHRSWNRKLIDVS